MRKPKFEVGQKVYVGMDSVNEKVINGEISKIFISQGVSKNKTSTSIRYTIKFDNNNGGAYAEKDVFSSNSEFYLKKRNQKKNEINNRINKAKKNLAKNESKLAELQKKLKNA